MLCECAEWCCALGLLFWQSEARRLKMELDVVVGELRTVQLHQGHAAEQGMGDAKRAWDAVNQAKQQSEADQKRFADELNHERQRCSSLLWCYAVLW